MKQYALTRDGFLQIRVNEDAAAHVLPWLPLHALPADGHTARAIIRAGSARKGAVPTPRAPAQPLARLASVALWRDADFIRLDGAGVRGIVDSTRGRARIIFDPAGEVVDADAALGFAAALLLAHAGRFLVHAAAVARDDGGVLLLAGDTHAGKSTTALNLARAGWRFLSDDHVVLYRDAEGRWCAEGWPRRMQVDAGWPDGQPRGVRVPAEPGDVEGIRHADGGVVAGVLLPRVDASAHVTQLQPARQSDVVAALVRQSAWSVAEPQSAAAAMTAFTEIASFPCSQLVLAGDTFNDPARLRAVVGASWSSK